MANFRVELPSRFRRSKSRFCAGNYFRKKAIEKTILRLPCPSEFSHSLGPKRTLTPLKYEAGGHILFSRSKTVDSNQWPRRRGIPCFLLPYRMGGRHA